jgi:hypothetical protein
VARCRELHYPPDHELLAKLVTEAGPAPFLDEVFRELAQREPAGEGWVLLGTETLPAVLDEQTVMIGGLFFDCTVLFAPEVADATLLNPSHWKLSGGGSVWSEGTSAARPSAGYYGLRTATARFLLLPGQEPTALVLPGQEPVEARRDPSVRPILP